MVMTAMPAVHSQGDATADATYRGTSMSDSRNGRFLTAEEYGRLRVWVQNIKNESDRKQSTAEAQIKHLVGVMNTYKRQAEHSQSNLQQYEGLEKTAMQRETEAATSKYMTIWRQGEERIVNVKKRASRVCASDSVQSWSHCY